MDDIDLMWEALQQTTITGREYVRRGEPDSGKWGEAKAYRDKIKKAFHEWQGSMSESVSIKDVVAIKKTTFLPPASTASQKFGISTGYPIAYWDTTKRNAYYAAIASAGFTIVRFDYVNSTPGQLCDNHVQSALLAGLEVRLMIGGSPSDAPSTYAARCTSCVNYFKTWVSEYELMNEPNLQSGWVNGVNYANVAKAGSVAIRAAMPSARVILGAISNHGVPGTTDEFYPPTWLTRCYSISSPSWFDAVDYHPYGFYTNATGSQMFTNPSGWQIMESATGSTLRSVMIANGDTNKKIHVSEHGAPTYLAADWPQNSPSSVSPQAQADLFTLSINDWVTHSWAGDFYAYSFRDRAPDEQTGNLQGHFGIILNDNATPGSDTHKPAYNAITTLI